MVGAGYFQGASRAAGLTISGSKSLAAMTTSTVGMGALSGSSYYMSVMGQDWFSEMSPAQRVTLATVNGLAEGLGESVSAHIFNRMIAPALVFLAKPLKRHSVSLSRQLHTLMEHLFQRKRQPKLLLSFKLNTSLKHKVNKLLGKD